MHTFTSQCVRFFGLAALALTLGACSSGDESDEDVSDAVASTTLFDAYDLAELPSGAIAAFATTHGSQSTTLLLRLGASNERSAVIPTYKLPAGAAPWRTDAKGRLYKIGLTWQPYGATRLRLVRVTPSVIHGVLTPTVDELWQSAWGSSDYSAAVSAPSLDVASDGTAHLLYGDRSSNGQPSGFHLVTCPAGGACASTLVAADKDASAGSGAVVVDAVGVSVVLRRNDAPPGQVEVYAGAPGSLTKLTLTDPAYAYASVLAARGAGRTVIGIQGKTALTLLERSGSSTWGVTGRLRSLTRTEGRTGLVVTPDGAVVTSQIARYHGELTSAMGQPHDMLQLARVFRQSDDYTGQDLPAQRWLGSVLLSSGKVFYVEPKQSGWAWGPGYAKTLGTPLRFRDPSRGAGSLEKGRDPCFWESVGSGGEGLAVLSAYKSGNTWQTSDSGDADASGKVVIDLAPSDVLTIRPGTCLYAHAIVGDGEVRFEGTANSPIHVVGTLVAARTVKAAYTFFDGVSDAGIGNGHKTAHGPLGESGALDHVSMIRNGTFRVAHEDWPVALSPQDPTTYAVTNSDFGPIDGDLFSFANPVKLTVSDSFFHDVAGAAIAIANHGFNKSALTVTRARLERVEAGARVISVTAGDRAQYLQSLASQAPQQYALLKPLFDQPAATPVAFLDVTVTGPTTPAALPQLFPGILLDSSTGRLDGVNVSGARSDGVRLTNSGAIVIATSNLSTNGRHGLRVEAEPPPGLGPCIVPPVGKDPNPPIIYSPPDPVVEQSDLENNVGAGIHVSGPHIPMVVRGNRISHNGLPGYVIEHGRAKSARRDDPSCGANGYRDDSVEVDLPLSPLTKLSQNDLVGNDAKALGLGLSSDHRLGTLPASGNYWGVSGVASAAHLVHCVGACTIAPVLSSPARP